MSLCGDSIYTRTKNVKYCLICYGKTEWDRLRDVSYFKTHMIEVYIHIYHIRETC